MIDTTNLQVVKPDLAAGRRSPQGSLIAIAIAGGWSYDAAATAPLTDLWQDPMDLHTLFASRPRVPSNSGISKSVLG